MRVPCPLDTQATEFTWSVIFIFIYPVGIPTTFAVLLWYFSVPEIVQMKLQFYRFKSVVGTFGVANLPDSFRLSKALDAWTWHTNPVNILNRNQLLALLRHDWARSDTTEDVGIVCSLLL